jgi:hypothetical protein
VSRADAVAGLVTVWFALAVLTAVGARHRRHAWGPALASGLLFPVTWVMWYLTDARPERKTTRMITANCEQAQPFGLRPLTVPADHIR